MKIDFAMNYSDDDAMVEDRAIADVLGLIQRISVLRTSYMVVQPATFNENPLETGRESNVV